MGIKLLPIKLWLSLQKTVMEHLWHLRVPLLHVFVRIKVFVIFEQFRNSFWKGIFDVLWSEMAVLAVSIHYSKEMETEVSHHVWNQRIRVLIHLVRIPWLMTCTCCECKLCDDVETFCACFHFDFFLFLIHSRGHIRAFWFLWCCSCWPLNLSPLLPITRLCKPVIHLSTTSSRRNSKLWVDEWLELSPLLTELLWLLLRAGSLEVVSCYFKLLLLVLLQDNVMIRLDLFLVTDVATITSFEATKLLCKVLALIEFLLLPWIYIIGRSNLIWCWRDSCHLAGVLINKQLILWSPKFSSSWCCTTWINWLKSIAYLDLLDLVLDSCNTHSFSASLWPQFFAWVHCGRVHGCELGFLHIMAHIVLNSMSIKRFFKLLTSKVL